MDKSVKSINIDESRRHFIKKAAYSAPAIVTMVAIPSFASAGSGWSKGNEGVGNGYDAPPPGHDKNYNDPDGSGPGNPSHQFPK